VKKKKVTVPIATIILTGSARECPGKAGPGILITWFCSKSIPPCLQVPDNPNWKVSEQLYDPIFIVHTYRTGLPVNQ